MKNGRFLNLFSLNQTARFFLFDREKPGCLCIVNILNYRQIFADKFFQCQL